MKPVLTLVISGGQSGVDQGALRAAKAVGLVCGGWAAKGWLVETPDGRGEQSAPWLADYGLTECDVPGFAARRHRNVRHSDGSLLLGRADSHGSVGLINDCRKAFKPLFHVQSGVTRSSEAAAWVIENHIKVLNVAGNRESSDPGIGARSERFLIIMFRIVLSSQGKLTDHD
jgi:hypothetical protein